MENFEIVSAGIRGFEVENVTVSCNGAPFNESVYNVLADDELLAVRRALGNGVRGAVWIQQALAVGDEVEFRVFVRLTDAEGYSEGHCYIVKGTVDEFWTLPEPEETTETAETTETTAE